jgi:hypothetical protein
MILHCVPTRVPLASDLPPTIEHFAFGEYRGLLQLVFETVDVLPRLGVLTCGSYQRIIMLQAKVQNEGRRCIACAGLPFGGHKFDTDGLF